VLTPRGNQLDIPGSVAPLGHAGFAVTYAGKRLVIDPWFYPAFCGSWFPWPDNRNLAWDAREMDVLYISHAHEDHFDRRFLASVAKDTLVLVPRFRSRRLERDLRDLGFTRLVVLGHGEQHQLGPGFTASMLLDESGKEDSALLLDMGNYRFLDSNDCELPLSAWPGQVDLLACQYSGASWYPQCYVYPRRVMAAKTREVRDLCLERLARRVHATGAKAYMPSAGPPVFLDPALAGYNNRDGIFPWWEDVATGFEIRCPGVRVVPPPQPVYGVGEYRQAREREWRAWYEQPDTPASAGEVAAHFAGLARRNRAYLGDWRRDIRLTAGRSAWDLSLGAVTPDLEDAPADPGFRMHVPPRVLRAVLDGRTGWEEALLSMRLRLRPADDSEYDLALFTLLTYGGQPARTLAEARRRDDSELIARDGITMQRWCPHAGEDLAYATVMDGVVECPRHHWRWDAKTGECLSGGDTRLRVTA